MKAKPRMVHFGLVALVVTVAAIPIASRGGYGLLERQQHPRSLQVLVDGADDPSKISDEVAYWMLFKTLQRRQIGGGGEHVPRSYAHRIFAQGTRSNSDPSQDQRAISVRIDAQADRLVGAVASFEKRFGEIEALKKSNAQAYAGARSALIAEIRTSLSSTLGAEGTSHVDAFVQQVIKRRIKLLV